MRPPDDLLTRINSDDVIALQCKVARNDQLTNYQKQNCAIYLNLACLFDDG